MSDTLADFKLYWKVWGMLLALTVVMLFLDRAPMPPVLFVVVMVGAMLTKAGLISAYFMHLRYEAAFLQWMLIVGLLINGAFLFFLIIPDAYRILAMTG